MQLIDFPPEIIQAILLLCDALDVASVAQTCRFLHALIYHAEDDALWRGLYLAQPLDDPRMCKDYLEEKVAPTDWARQLQRFTRARQVIRKGESVGRPGELKQILQTMIDLVSYTPTKGPQSEVSKNLSMAQYLLGDGWIDFLESEEVPRTLDEEEIKLVSRLHTYYGLTPQDIDKAKRFKSRSFVYNMANYHFDNEFGPFDDQGNIDWVHVNAIRHTMCAKLLLNAFGGNESELVASGVQYSLYPLSLPFIQPLQMNDNAEAASSDWAGVQGSWMVSFCFCDHRELLQNMNKIDGPGFPSPSLFTEDSFYDIYRCLQFEIKVTAVEHDANYPTRPTIRFVGIMEGAVEQTLVGTVRAADDGHARWRFVSGESGNSVWSSHGVQIGGIRSEYGVLGSWSTVFHDPDDPIGPFWMRKVPPTEHIPNHGEEVSS